MKAYRISKRNVVALILGIAALLLFALFTNAGKEGFKLTNDFSGQDQCLDSGPKDALMAPCGEGLGQQWSTKATTYIPPKKIMNQNPEAGNKCLDLTNGKPAMAECTNTPNQLWWLQANKTIQNVTAGLTKCLGIMNAGEKNKLVLEDCSPDVLGQEWGAAGSLT